MVRNVIPSTPCTIGPCRRRKLPTVVVKRTNGRRFYLVNALVLILVVHFVPRHIIVAFQNSYSSITTYRYQLLPPTKTTNTIHRLPRDYKSTSRSHNDGLYALLQESDQREKKQSQTSDSSLSGTNGETQPSSPPNTEPTKDDFTLHIGRALDTLRQEYPTLLTQSPDYSLYDDHVCLCVDLPTSPLTALTYNSISGLSRYKMVWDMTHTTLSLIYNLDHSYMSSIKLCHDRVRGNIVRVQWHAVLFPRWQKHETVDTTPPAVGGGNHNHPPPPSSKCHHVDGISVYELDWTTGKIIQHRIEQLVYTNNVQPVMVMDDVLLRQTAKVIGGGIPMQIVEKSCDTNIAASAATNDLGGSFMVEFRSPIMNSFRRPPTSLFAMEAQQPTKLQPTATTKISSLNDSTSSSTTTTSTTSTAMNNKHDASVIQDDTTTIVSATSTDVTMIDMGAFDAKNKSRQKFGLQPLSVEEFLRVEHQVEQLAVAQQEAIKEAKLLARQQQVEKEAAAAAGSSIFDKVFGSVMKNLDTCESNFDCVRPQVCCDYVFAKKCCTSGSRILSNSVQPLQYARIPVYGGDNKPLPPQQQYPPSQRY